MPSAKDDHSSVALFIDDITALEAEVAAPGHPNSCRAAPPEVRETMFGRGAAEYAIPTTAAEQPHMK